MTPHQIRSRHGLILQACFCQQLIARYVLWHSLLFYLRVSTWFAALFVCPSLSEGGEGHTWGHGGPHGATVHGMHGLRESSQSSGSRVQWVCLQLVIADGAVTSVLPVCFVGWAALMFVMHNGGHLSLSSMGMPCTCGI